jgi:hypothetical protein
VEVPVNLNSKVGAKKVISRFQESFGNKCAVLQDQIDRKRAPFQPLRQRLAFHAFHHQIVHTALITHIMQSKNVRMN